MQIGGRWRFGQEPPRNLPDELRAAIAHAERTATESQRQGSWTLTWLEGKPVAELDGGPVISLAPTDARGEADDAEFDDEEELFPET